MMETEPSGKESSIAFPTIKVGTNHANEGRGKSSFMNLSSNLERGRSKKSKTGHLINSISALIIERLTEFRSDMFTIVNKNNALRRYVFLL